jgi:hypothetical protein
MIDFIVHFQVSPAAKTFYPGILYLPAKDEKDARAKFNKMIREKFDPELEEIIITKIEMV